jgi:ureidoacrylate peracid hydrolase
MSQIAPRIEVEARPSSILLDPRETAVLVVDMQQGFFGLGGGWDRAGVDVAGAQAILAPLARTLAAAREAALPIVYLTAEFGVPTGDARLWDAARGERWMELAGVAGGAGHGRTLPPGVREGDILPDVAPMPGETVIVKRRFSGFYETPLQAVLQERGIGTLIIAGGTTSVCVESTLRDAYFRDYRCLLLADCTAEPIGHGLARTNHDATLLMVEVLFGWVTTSEHFIQALAFMPPIS